MSLHNRPRRTALNVRALEDRTTPAGLSFFQGGFGAGFFSFFDALRNNIGHHGFGVVFGHGHDNNGHGGGQQNSGASSTTTDVLSGTVYQDSNGDGAIDTGDTGMAGVEVDLVNASGTVVAKATTAADGSYSFSNMAAGTYSIQVVPPDSSYLMIPPTTGTAGGSADPSWAAVDNVQVANNTNGTGYNFGMAQGRAS
jgi:SdrD B-like domain